MKVLELEDRLMKNKTLNIIYIIILFPIVVLFLNSIFVNFQYEDILPKTISFKNYKVVFSSQYLKLLFSSILISLIASILALVFSYLFARVIRSTNNSIVKIFKTLSMIPLLIPAYSYIMGLGMALNIFRLNYTYIGVILSHIIVILPYDIYAINNSLEVIGTEYEEIATTIGASEINLIMDVSVPMIKRTIFISFALGFVISFSQYFLTLVIGGGVVKTYAMHILPLIQGNNRGLASSFAFIFCLINVIIYSLLSNISMKRDDIL